MSPTFLCALQAITRVTFGFPSVDAYYEASGSRRQIGNVGIPLLTVQAKDDPIAVTGAIPRSIISENHHVVLIETERGGHLGWTAGNEAPFGAPWPDALAISFFEAVRTENTTTSTRRVRAKENSLAV